MSGATGPRPLPHAVLDLASRQWKGEKIARLLGIANSDRDLRILEVGAGSGGISGWFGLHPSGRFRVDAVDVVDSRRTTEGFRFQLVPDTLLPFPDETFDVVLSNHVIEHVGSVDEQRSHLAELRRVLKASGRAYLAVPNRWMIVEPHFRLAFLSWLPESLRTPYVRVAGRGEEYDCRPLTTRGAERLFREAGFRATQHCGDAIRLTYEIEAPQSRVYRRLLRRVPDDWFARLGPILPTLIYTLEPV